MNMTNMEMQDMTDSEQPARLMAVETIRNPIQPNVTIVALHHANGAIGLGETFYGAGAVEAHIHEVAAPLLATDGSTAPAAAARALAGYVGYSGSGAEVRANSAIDIALWDGLAKQAGLPLRHLLGGPTRHSIPVYNTCAGRDYVKIESRQSSSNWGVAAGDSPFEDLWAFLHQPGKLATELRDAGYRGMKVWPFDLAAEASHGDHTADLSAGLRVVDEIRASVGDEMDIYVELHSLWNLRGAQRLLRHLEPYDLTWVEDPIRADNVHALATLAGGTSVPIAVGENAGAGSNAYHPLFERKAIDIGIIDLGWHGGITAGLRTAALAEQYGIPIAPHDCTGPISLATAAHFVTAISNGFVQEVARAFYHGWYGEIARGLPTIEDGSITPSEAPGHGIELSDEFLAHPTTTRRVTRL